MSKDTFDFVGKCQGFLATCEGPTPDAELRRSDSGSERRRFYHARDESNSQHWMFAFEMIQGEWRFTVYDILKGIIIHEEMVSE
jgi:hypothetical protein